MAFSLIVLLIILGITFNEDSLHYLTHINIFFLLVAGGLRFVSFAIWAGRVQVMSASLNYKVPFGHCFNLVIANLLAGAITPGQAGGEPVRIHELYRAGLPAGDATAVVIMERFLDGLILIVLAIGSLFLMWDTVWKMGIGVVSIIFCSMILLISFNLVLLYGAKNPVKTKKWIMALLRRIERRIPKPSVTRFIERTDAEYDTFSTGISTFSGHGRRDFFLGAVLSVMFWFSEFIVASVILMGLGLPPVIAESMIAQILIALVSMIPLTPGSSGIAEISATSFYALFVPTAALGVFVLLWRVVMFYLNIVFGTVATMLIFRRELILEPKR